MLALPLVLVVALSVGACQPAAPEPTPAGVRAEEPTATAVTTETPVRTDAPVASPAPASSVRGFDGRVVQEKEHDKTPAALSH